MCIIANVLRLRFKCIQHSVKRLLIACFVDLETDDILLKFDSILDVNFDRG